MTKARMEFNEKVQQWGLRCRCSAFYLFDETSLALFAEGEHDYNACPCGCVVEMRHAHRGPGIVIAAQREEHVIPDENIRAHFTRAVVGGCFRGTLLENIHADGRISEEEMKALMTEAMNKVYTLLTYPGLAFRGTFGASRNWDPPKIVKTWEKMAKFQKISREKADDQSN